MKIKFLLLLIFAFTFTTLRAQDPDRFIEITSSKQNTEYADFGPHFYKDSLLVYASSKKDLSIKRKDRSHNRMGFLNFYKATITADGSLIDPQRLSNEKLNMIYASDLTISSEGKTIYFTLNNYVDDEYMSHLRKSGLKTDIKKIFRATLSKGLMGELKEMSISNNQYSVMQPHISRDGRTLYFVADIPEIGLGGLDIYKVAVNENGTYGEPENLGPNVNTDDDETFPFLSDTNTLYFSSNGRGGSGGFDIFFSNHADGKFSKAQNLARGFSSPYDDFSFAINTNKGIGYFSSTRPGVGDVDLYKFRIKPKPIPKVECIQTIAGTVTSKSTRIPITDVGIGLYQDNKLIEKTVSKIGGKYEFEAVVDCEKTYNVIAEFPNYLPSFLDLTTIKKNKYQNVLDIQLEEVQEFVTVRNIKMVRTNPIHFDLNESKIRKDAAIELDKVVKILNKSPEIKIEVRAHTDSRANDAYNMKLSNARAESTINYIRSKGIDASRVYGQGYGEKELINECSNGVKCTPAKHEENRRTEFVVVNE